MENSDNDKSVASGVHPERTLQMKLDILFRRKRLLTLDRGGNITPTSLKLLAEQLTESNRRNGISKVVTYSALRRDYERKRTWAPLVWALLDDVKNTKKSVKEIRRDLTLARMKAVTLMDSADNDSAKVGAIRAVVAIVDEEVRIGQSTGELPRAVMEQNVTNVNVIQQIAFTAATNGLLRDYEFLFKRGVAKSDLRPDGSEQPVVET